MTKTAYCKINLTLEILGTARNDGFHDLKSVMHKIPLGDKITLDITEGRGNIHFSCDSNVCNDTENLAYLAAKAYLEKYTQRTGKSFDIFIKLEKITPAGAGLGGGSADAACVLDMLCEKTGNIDGLDIEQLAASLGSDTVFCLKRYKCAYCTGRGEMCRSIDTLPKDTAVVIAKPKDSLNTAGIYKSYDQMHGDDYTKSMSDGMEEALKKGDKSGIASYCTNDFEQVCIPRLAQIASLKEKLSSCGAYVSSMSGSGSAVYGLFDDGKKALLCKSLLEKTENCHAFVFTKQDFEKMYSDE